jgi:nitroreductase
MEFESVIRGRRSIRAYKPDAVPESIVREILDEARWAPSWRNTQGWEVWAVSGAALERFKDGFKAAVENSEPAAGLDLPSTAEWPETCSARTAELMRVRKATLDAAGEASDPATALARMAELFGAPWLLVFGFDSCLAEAYASFDVGMLVQNATLAAVNKGLGTCLLATPLRYSPILREVLPDTQGKHFVIAMTLGVPDLEHPANTFARSRADLDEFVTWVS